VVEWLPVFTRPEAVQIVLDSLKFLQAQERLTIYGYVVMENHLHMVAVAPNLSETMQSFKSFTARKITTTWPTTSCGTRWRAATSYGKKGFTPSYYRMRKCFGRSWNTRT